MQLISILSDIPEGTFNFILELIIKIIIIILELSQIKKKSWTINKASLMDYSVYCTLTKRELFLVGFQNLPKDSTFIHYLRPLF